MVDVKSFVIVVVSGCRRSISSADMDSVSGYYSPPDALIVGKPCRVLIPRQPFSQMFPLVCPPFCAIRITARAPVFISRIILSAMHKLLIRFGDLCAPTCFVVLSGLRSFSLFLIRLYSYSNNNAIGKAKFHMYL